MKSLVSIFLATLFFAGSLFPKSDMDELFKIPALFEHYSEHKAKSKGELSFMDFLLMHYAVGSTHDEASHDKLPLSMDMCTGIICVLQSTFYQIVHPNTHFVKPSFSFYCLQYSFLSVFSLLNPPR